MPELLKFIQDYKGFKFNLIRDDAILNFLEFENYTFLKIVLFLQRLIIYSESKCFLEIFIFFFSNELKK
ncbi:hypothetical protein BpHYR1_012331 [Brachionus plicatilis]|uniref:Uncharacterized protein n=1 Tax=Brachionus plicatilis TaxID=10195 RepID=A0A3M7RQ09_BRAPC|nr:hypothetical protein BpHYR1_012331 [Brachionus plicatilis]